MARRERRRLCKFISDWTASVEFSSWLTPVKGEKHKAYCLLCKKVFAVSHGGLNDVKAHYKGIRHIRLQRQQEKIAAGLSNQWKGREDCWVKNIIFNEQSTTQLKTVIKNVCHMSSMLRRLSVRYWSFENLATLIQSKLPAGDGAKHSDRGDTLDLTDAVEEAHTYPESVLSIEEDTLRYNSSQPGVEYWDLGFVAGRHSSEADHEEIKYSEKMNSQQKMLPQQYCLRWKYHHNNLQVMFSQLLERESFCDVTLACEGKTLRAHKVVLSACSTYFDAIFSQYEEKNPIVILKDVKFTDIRALVEFMYKGEINIDHSHLASLLKAAEDLRIKGLAEVSWRSDGQANQQVEDSMNCSDSRVSQVDSVANETELEPPLKRRRGRPPMDSSFNPSFNPKVTSISGAVGTEDAFTEGAASSDIDNEASVWPESESDVVSRDAAPETSAPPTESLTEPVEEKPVITPYQEGVSQRVAEQFRDVVKLNDYLTTGRRQQFWEEPFTRRIMESIKSKELEMKAGAELLGVSYGTLYGRYRDAYGCLKHPYRDFHVNMAHKCRKVEHPATRARVRDFWSESGPADVLAKVQRKEITLFRAAEMLNVTVTTLANYLSTLRPGGSSSGDEGGEETLEEFFEDTATSTPKKLATAALENNPDITIVKQEPTPIANHEQDVDDDDDDDDDDDSSSSIATNNNAEHLVSDAEDSEHAANGMEDPVGN